MRPFCNDRKEHNAQDRSADRADAALEARAAQDDGREHVELASDQALGTTSSTRCACTNPAIPAVRPE